MSNFKPIAKLNLRQSIQYFTLMNTAVQGLEPNARGCTRGRSVIINKLWYTLCWWRWWTWHVQCRELYCGLKLAQIILLVTSEKGNDIDYARHRILILQLELHSVIFGGSKIMKNFCLCMCYLRQRCTCDWMHLKVDDPSHWSIEMEQGISSLHQMSPLKRKKAGQPCQVSSHLGSP